MTMSTPPVPRSGETGAARRTGLAPVFHIDRSRLALPDVELAGLLRELARVLPPGHAGKLAGAIASAVSGRDGKQPGAVHVAGMGATGRQVVARVLADGAAQAQAGQHPAAGRLAELAQQFGRFAGS